MIRYTLKCERGHAFEAWFASSAAYDGLRAAGQVSCAVCGSTEIEKALMAPALGGTRGARDAGGTAEPETTPAPLSTPASPREAAIARLRREIEQRCDYVGASFATEARDMHTGAAESRAIWGEASAEDARALIEDGVPVAPLPFMTKRNG